MGSNMVTWQQVLLAIMVLLNSPTKVVVRARDVYQQWVVSYTNLAPLGSYKQVIVINDQFPGPLLNTTTNDVVHVHVINRLSEPFLLTWNGVQQRRNSWYDGVEGTNCPIQPGRNWTYIFQVKDQIGSFFYYPTLHLQKASGGYGPIRINNRAVIPIPFPQPDGQFDILVGDWYNKDHRELRSSLDSNGELPPYPDGILINGLGRLQANFTVQSESTYLLRISNVGVKTSINFRIQNHTMVVLETEGSYLVQEEYSSLDIHLGQSYSVLLTANQPNASYYIVSSSRFLDRNITGLAILRYEGSTQENPVGLVPEGPANFNYNFSIGQALSMRLALSVGAARPNPQGMFHYGYIAINRFMILQNNKVQLNKKTRYTVNDVSFVYPDTPLKLADYFKIDNVFVPGIIPDVPLDWDPAEGTFVLDARYRDFVHIVFENLEPTIQSWHIDGYSFFVVGMGSGMWEDKLTYTYNMRDAVYRSTVQVYPNSWTAVMLALDNYGMWNIRSQDEEKRYLGQELYIRVRNYDETRPSPRDELPLPHNVILCGRADPRPV